MLFSSAVYSEGDVLFHFKLHVESFKAIPTLGI